MLRASAKTSETDVDIQGIGGDVEGADRGIPFGSQLMRFAEALATNNPDDLASSRQALLDAAGPEVLVDAAGVAANFQRMVRIADAIGIPYDNADSQMSQDITRALGLDRFASAKHTTSRSKQ